MGVACTESLLTDRQVCFGNIFLICRYYIFKKAIANNLSGKCCVWKLKKDFYLSINMLFENKHYLSKKCFLQNAAIKGYRYIFSCKQINTCMLIEWMSKVLMLMVNVEQYLLRSRWNWLPKSCLYWGFFSCTQVLEIWKKGQHSELM